MGDKKENKQNIKQEDNKKEKLNDNKVNNEKANDEKVKVEENNQMPKVNFFKRIWYSITKIEKYPEMSAEGIKVAMIYVAGIVAILTIVSTIGIIYRINKITQNIADYVESNVPDFSYKDGQFSTESKEPIYLQNDELQLGKVIINLNDISEEEINQYKNQINDYGSGILILKDKVLLEEINIDGEISYSYSDLLSNFELSEFNKKDALDYVRSNKIINMYLSLFMTLYIYSFLMYLVSTLWIALVIAVLGYFAAILAKIKMRFVAVFNMAIYSLTLSTFLNLIYVLINIFTTFDVTYFQVMYISVAFIYLIAAIFIIRADFIKKQAELTKIAEIQKRVKQEFDDQEQEQKDEKEKQERKKKDKEEEKKNKEKPNEEENPKGSEA